MYLHCQERRKRIVNDLEKEGIDRAFLNDLAMIASRSNIIFHCISNESVRYREQVTKSLLF